MGIGNFLVMSQVTFYILSFIISFFIFIPLTVNHNEFNGRCLLHATGKWEKENATGPEKLDVTWGNPGECDFGIFVGVVLFPLSLFYILWMSVYLFKGTEPSWASAFIALLVSVVVCMMTFVSACVVSSGYQMWCSALQPRLSCEFAEYEEGFLKEKDINTGSFNTEMGMAQFGLWSCMVIWMLLVVLSGVQLYQYHNQENFFISLHRERERLVQRVNPNSPSSYSV